MNTREIAAEYRLSHWAQVMHERSESGLSIKAFCEKVGFHENRYYYWQRKLRETAYEQMTGLQAEVNHISLNAPGFAEVRLAEATMQPVLPETGNPGQLQAEVGGIRITVDSTYPSEKLAQLLRELARS